MKRSPMKRSVQMASGGSELRRSAMPAGAGVLRRSSELGRTGGLRRAAFDRSPIELGDDAASEVKKAPAQYRRMKSKGPKMTPIRKSAKGELCTLQIPGICRNRTDTTVWCHSNRLADGKGLGLKAHDEAGCYGCVDCHTFLDGGWAARPEWSFEDVQQYFEVARARSRTRLVSKGLIAA
jgi:hypothetical protein